MSSSVFGLDDPGPGCEAICVATVWFGVPGMVPVMECTNGRMDGMALVMNSSNIQVAGTYVFLLLGDLVQALYRRRLFCPLGWALESFQLLKDF